MGRTIRHRHSKGIRIHESDQVTFAVGLFHHREHRENSE
jgi:hypothetical protein